MLYTMILYDIDIWLGIFANSLLYFLQAKYLLLTV